VRSVKRLSRSSDILFSLSLCTVYLISFLLDLVKLGMLVGIFRYHFSASVNKAGSPKVKFKIHPGDIIAEVKFSIVTYQCKRKISCIESNSPQTRDWSGHTHPNLIKWGSQSFIIKDQ